MPAKQSLEEKRTLWLGREITTKTGDLCKVISMSDDCEFVTVEFDDNSTKTLTFQTVKGKKFSKRSNAETKTALAKAKYEGMKRTNKEGLEMEIISWRHKGNAFLVRFSNGIDRLCYSLDSFKDGSFLSYNISEGMKVGYNKVAKNGLKMVITEVTKDKVKLRFEDGVEIVTLKCNYNQGNIAREYDRAKALSTKFTNSQGLDYRIIELIKVGNRPKCRVHFDIDNKEYIAEYGRARKGSIVHPGFPSSRGCIGYKVGTSIVNGFAFKSKTKNMMYYYCHCKSCCVDDVMTIPEMLKHECSEDV